MPPAAARSAQSKAISEPVYAGNPVLHDEIVAKILEKTGFTAHEFQANATKAVLDGLDVVLHAGTGSGKTLIFTTPHFLLKNKVSIVISPLILLQQDQQERMRKLGLKAVAINKEVHLKPEVWEVSLRSLDFDFC
ncbi:hypothetical protein FRC12_020149 [Ceratobasidium sp. 428]|nr:hypothetical protein FRC12_020149 [Ceratobasidium sp. 428]